MTQKLESLHLEVICDAVSLSQILGICITVYGYETSGRLLCLQDLLGWAKDKSEVEIVDLILKLKEKLVRKKIEWRNILSYRHVIIKENQL